MNSYPWKFPIDLLNKPEPMRRIKLVMMMRKIVKAIDRNQRWALAVEGDKRDQLVRLAKA